MRFFVAFLALVATCYAGSGPGSASSMTRESFNEIQLGEPITEVVGQVGEPYAIHDKGGGVEEYEYIENFTMNNELVVEHHYFIKVVQGKVVSKRVKDEKQPAYDLMYQEDPNYPTYP